jgi:hypothetical protein
MMNAASAARLFLLPLLALMSAARAGEKSFVIDPVRCHDAGSGEVVDVPGQSGVRGIRLQADMGLYGWCTLDLGRTCAAGQYRIEYAISATDDPAARIALYAAMGQDHHQITGVLACAKGQVSKLQAPFYSPIAFSSLVIKKMSAEKAPSVAVSQLVLTDLERQDYPRRSAYQAVMKYAAPWGLRSAVIEQEEDVGVMETWLDLRSGATEPYCRADYLFRLIRLQELPLETASVRQTLDQLRERLAANDVKAIPALLTAAEQGLDALEAAAAKALDGVVCPERGTDIFTWVKAWRYGGILGEHEYGEPTPYRAVYPGVQLAILEPGEAADLFSTWTTSTYKTDRLTATYTMLTPLTVVDVLRGRFDLTVTPLGTPDAANTPACPVPAPEGWFALRLQNSFLLGVLHHAAERIEWTGTRLTLDFSTPSAVGYVVLPASQEGTLAEIARFYQRLLLQQPVECVQVQRGARIEQTFEYVRRSGDWPALKPMLLAPVPHLAMLSRERQSAYHIRGPSAVARLPDGTGAARNHSTLRYRLPAMPLQHNPGANVFDDVHTSRAMLQELRQQGCRTIRQLTCSQTPWNLQNPGPAKALLQERLAWAREVGLKVGIDYHGGWDAGNLQTLPAFVATWQELLSWCKGYEDVIAWYDLLNEPAVFPDQGQPSAPYFEFMRGLVSALRPLAGNTPFLVECVSMANPGGLECWEDFSDPNIIVGYHDYWPHLFTHQLTVEAGNASYPHTFYPGFMPAMQWTAPSWRNECPAWHYWDRWKRDAVSEPAMRLIIRKGVRVDCGEYGVVGYAGDVCKRSGVLWLRHAMELYRRLNISHCAFSPAPNSGFTWLVPEFREEVLRFWKQCENSR